MKNFKLILKSLFSNNAAVEGARHRPWYFAVIMFFVSMILALVPIFVQNISKDGSDLVSKNTYNMDNLTLRFTETLKEKSITLEVSYNETTKSNILIDRGTWAPAFQTEHNYAFQNVDYPYYVHRDESGRDDLCAFYLGGMSSEVLSQFVTSIEESEKALEKPIPTLILMTETQIAFYVCNPQKNATIGTIVGDYKSSKVGFTIDSLLSEKAKDTPENYAAYRAETWENWKNFYDEVYDHNRLTSTWTSTVIMFGINAMIVFFMGLMVFILTRGKNNPFRIYTFWESMKVGFWAANMPAILTCGFGFLLTSFVQVMFALLIGVRVMWLTMKTLGPNNVPTPASSYKQVKTVDAKPIRK